MENRYCHSTLSNDFSVSKETAAVGETLLLGAHIILIKRLKLSAELRDRMKPTWSGSISVVITLLCRAARILAFTVKGVLVQFFQYHEIDCQTKREVRFPCP